jgi:hypothetical protein
MRLILIVLIFIVLTSCKKDTSTNINFIAFGDTPMASIKNQYELYEKLIQKINLANPSLVINTGDTHSFKVCSNDKIDYFYRSFNKIQSPVIYTPGDNDWLDCSDAIDGNFLYPAFEPLERLNYLRETYFNKKKTLGAFPLPLVNQSQDGHPENIRLVKDNIGYITLHVVGYKWNFSELDPNLKKEFYVRNKANLDWLDKSFKALEKTDAIVVAFHASAFEGIFESPRKIYKRITENKKILFSLNTYKRIIRTIFKLVGNAKFPHNDIVKSLANHSSEFNKPVLLLYGDTHDQRAYQPFKKLSPNLHAIEVFGTPDIKAIEITIKPKMKSPFKVVQVYDPY